MMSVYSESCLRTLKSKFNGLHEKWLGLYSAGDKEWCFVESHAHDALRLTLCMYKEEGQ